MTPNSVLHRARLAFALPLALVFVFLLACLLPARAAVYDAELSPELLHGPDLCAHAACRDVLPQATRFSPRKGAPRYVEGYAAAKDGGAEQVVGYVFLSTDVVDIPAYSGKPIVTLIGMDRQGIITGVRVLKHSEPILLAGIPESTLLDFIGQYVGLRGDAKRRGQMALAGAGRAEEVHHLAAANEAQLRQGEDAVAVERGLEGKVKA